MLRGYKGTMVADTPVIGRSNAAYWDSLCSLGRAKAQPLQHLGGAATGELVGGDFGEAVGAYYCG